MVYQFWFDAAKAGKLKPKQDICAYRYRDDVKAMLIEPVNSQPVVIVGAYGAQGNADFSRFVLHTFGERSNSGTQFLRDRINATLFFESLRPCEGLLGNEGR